MFMIGKCTRIRNNRDAKNKMKVLFCLLALKKNAHFIALFFRARAVFWAEPYNSAQKYQFLLTKPYMTQNKFDVAHRDRELPHRFESQKTGSASKLSTLNRSCTVRSRIRARHWIWARQTLTLQTYAWTRTFVSIEKVQKPRQLPDGAEK